MVNTIIFIAIAAIIGFGIGVYVSFMKKKKFKDTEPVYEDLYREAASRLKTRLEESNNQYSMQDGMIEQIVWHKNLLERVVANYEITDDQLYVLIKATNDSMGLLTPTKEEMKQRVEQVLKMMGQQEKLDEYKKSKEEKQKQITGKLDIDSILDKVSKMGINSLSEAEKEFLNKQ